MAELTEKTKVDLMDRDESSTPITLLSLALQEWELKRNRDLLTETPSTCIEAFATWWLDSMTPTIREDEDPMVGAVYARAALLRYLDLSENMREFIVNATQRGVFYRGEEPEQFIEIYHAIMAQRRIRDGGKHG